jgi:uncharacterized membrane protein required for colicin V production
MLLDLLIISPLILYTALGLRDGVVRKLVAIAVLIAGLFIGQVLMQPFGNFLSSRKIVNSADAPMYAFLFIFLGMFIVQSLLYRLITKNYKIGGVADRIAGTVLGFIEGMIFTSSMLVIFALSGFPDKETSRDTRLYKAVVNIAPQIMDLSSVVNPEQSAKAKGADSSGSTKGNENIKSGKQ